MKTGFVYIWFDRKHKRYYIGCHWGTENDGYICSSRWMRNSYKRRPQDFKRRIISKICSGRGDLLAEEYKWLQMIPNEQLGVRYYNLNNSKSGHWTTDDIKTLTIKQKLSIAQKRNFEDPVYRDNFMETRKHLPLQSDETREKRRESMKGKNVGRPKTKKYYESRELLKGRQISDEHKQNIKDAGVFKRLNTTKVSCRHCGTIGNTGNIARYHNDRCKRRFIIDGGL
jgi:hypothetical protein